MDQEQPQQEQSQHELSNFTKSILEKIAEDRIQDRQHILKIKEHLKLIHEAVESLLGEKKTDD